MFDKFQHSLSIKITEFIPHLLFNFIQIVYIFQTANRLRSYIKALRRPSWASL